MITRSDDVPHYATANHLPGNILILRGDLEILPPGRTTVSYDHLSQLVAEYLLRTVPDVDISAALSIMPYTLSEDLVFWREMNN